MQITWSNALIRLPALKRSPEGVDLLISLRSSDPSPGVPWLLYINSCLFPEFYRPQPLLLFPPQGWPLFHWHYRLNRNRRQSENNRIMHFRWPEFRGHKPFGNGSDSLVRTFDTDVEWEQIPIPYQLFTEGLFRAGHCAPSCGCAEPRTGGSPSSWGWRGQVRDKQFARWFRREGSRWPTSAVPRSLAPEAPSFGASVAMRVWGGECFCSDSLICLVLSESVSPLALLMCVSGYLPGSFLMSHKVSRYC